MLIEGVNDSSGYIAEFTDVTTEAVNETVTSGGIFVLEGHKIKVAGTHPDCGVYFVRPNSAPIYREKVSGNLAENTQSKIIGKIPNIGMGQWQVQVVSQWTHGSSLLKEPRTIVFPALLTVS